MALEGLDAVPWRRLSHAYGPATDVPDLLRALASSENATEKLRIAAERRNRTLRQHVIWTLWGNVFHQGTRWQVTSHVVPFLAEILRDAAPGDLELRRFLVTYLHHIAIGYPADAFPRLVDPDVTFADLPPPQDLSALTDIDDDGENEDYSNATMGGYARDCYRAVEATLPLVASCAGNDDQQLGLSAIQQLGMSAIALLGSFRSPTAADALRTIVSTQSGRRQAVALVALAQNDPATTRAVATPLISHEDRFISVHAAAALVLAAPTNIAEPAILELTRPLDELTEEETPLTTTVGALVSRTLEWLPAEHLDTVIRSIATTLQAAQTMTSLSATASLLRLAFPEGQAPATSAELTASQRVALEAIAAYGGFLLRGMQFGNYSLLLGGYKLPTTADKLRAWLFV